MTFEGQANFRDLGGMPTVDGGRLRGGMLYRSGNFEDLTDADWRRFEALGIATVCDLRTDHERELHPTRWPADAAPEVLALKATGSGGAFSVDTLKEIAGDPTGDAARSSIAGNYRAMPAQLAPALAMLAARILQPGGLPAIVHCTAGKDRTGLVVAFLLEALGVTTEAIVADYRDTDRFYRAEHLTEHLHQMGLPRSTPPAPSVLEAFASVPEHLETAHAAIEAQFGSFDRYLAEAAGIDQGTRDRLRDLLVEDTGRRGNPAAERSRI